MRRLALAIVCFWATSSGCKADEREGQAAPRAGVTQAPPDSDSEAPRDHDTKAATRAPSRRPPRVTSVGPLRLPSHGALGSGVAAELVITGVDQTLALAEADARIAATLRWLRKGLEAEAPTLTAWLRVLDPTRATRCVLADQARLALRCELALRADVSDAALDELRAPANLTARLGPRLRSGERASLRVTFLEPSEPPSLGGGLDGGLDGSFDGGLDQALDRASKKSGATAASAQDGLRISARSAAALLQLAELGAKGLGPDAVSGWPAAREVAAAIDGDLERIDLRFWLELERPTLDVAVRWRPDSVAARDYRAALSTPLKQEFLRQIPPNTIAFVAAGVDASQWLSASADTPLALAAMSLVSQSPIGPALRSNRELRSLLRDAVARVHASDQGAAPRGSLLALDRNLQGGLGLTLLVDAKTTLADRDRWRSWAQAISPDRWLRADLAAAVELRVELALPHFGGALVDRVVLSPSADADPNVELPAWLSAGLVIERTEIGDRVLYAFGPAPRDDVTRRWVEWLQRPPAKRTWLHLGSYASPPAGLPWLAGVDTTAVARAAGLEHFALHGSLDDLRLWAGVAAPSDPVWRLQLSSDLMRALDPASNSKAAAPAH